MKNRYLIGERDLTNEFNIDTYLKYYIIEETREYLDDIHLYGIQVEKITYKNNKKYLEKETTPALSYSRGVVEELTHKLINNEVTPMGLIEVVDEYISMC